MTLRSQVVNLNWLHLLHNVKQATGICKIAVVEDETAISCVWVLIQMINAVCVEKRSAPLYTMNFITFFKKSLGQICTVLPSNSSD